MGLEPTTTGITIRDSTFELRSPSYAALACPAGLEPTTPSLEGWCSIRLSYGQPPGHGPMVGVERFELPTSCSQTAPDYIRGSINQCLVTLAMFSRQRKVTEKNGAQRQRTCRVVTAT